MWCQCWNPFSAFRTQKKPLINPSSFFTSFVSYIWTFYILEYFCTRGFKYFEFSFPIICLLRVWNTCICKVHSVDSEFWLFYSHLKEPYTWLGGVRGFGILPNGENRRLQYTHDTRVCFCQFDRLIAFRVLLVECDKPGHVSRWIHCTI